jgi:hypothetical protein
MAYLDTKELRTGFYGLYYSSIGYLEIALNLTFIDDRIIDENSSEITIKLYKKIDEKHIIDNQVNIFIYPTNKLLVVIDKFDNKPLLQFYKIGKKIKNMERFLKRHYWSV